MVKNFSVVYIDLRNNERHENYFDTYPEACRFWKDMCNFFKMNKGLLWIVACYDNEFDMLLNLDGVIDNVDV